MGERERTAKKNAKKEVDRQPNPSNHNATPLIENYEKHIEEQQTRQPENLLTPEQEESSRSYTRRERIE